MSTEAPLVKLTLSKVNKHTFVALAKLTLATKPQLPANSEWKLLQAQKRFSLTRFWAHDIEKWEGKFYVFLLRYTNSNGANMHYAPHPRLWRMRLTLNDVLTCTENGDILKSWQKVRVHYYGIGGMAFIFCGCPFRE
jgi:hypothetical protein